MFDKKLISQLAEPSKIAFDDNEIEQMSFRMADIIQLMDKVKLFSEDGAEPCGSASLYADLRRDDAKPSLETDKITQNAKQVKENSFVVPKVV